MSERPTICRLGHSLTHIGGDYYSCGVAENLIEQPDETIAIHASRGFWHWTRNALGEVGLCVAERSVEPLLTVLVGRDADLATLRAENERLRGDVARLREALEAAQFPLLAISRGQTAKSVRASLEDAVALVRAALTRQPSSGETKEGER